MPCLGTHVSTKIPNRPLHQNPNLPHQSHQSDPPPHSQRLSHCPYDPRHRVPPESLFRHSLRCRRRRPGIDPALLDSLHYPKTLKSDEQLSKDDIFMPGSDELMCFSIDDYGGLGSSPNFYYKDCPGVVCCGELDECDNRVFTIPSVLYLHCVNVMCDGCEERKDFDCGRVRILPSEVWAVRGEVEAWRDYPCEYSFSVLRVALCLPMIRDNESVQWVVSNSARFGVVIDVAMSEHVYLLLKLCLKAVSYEARRSGKLYDCGVGDVNLRSIRFACPVLVDAMTWFASQLSVLYGEANAKLFLIEMVKHFMLNAASRLMMFRSDEKKAVVSASTVGCGKLDDSSNSTIGESVGAIESKNVKIEEPTDSSGKENLLGGENKRSDLVYVSQVAAAVAALHERSMLEEKIKGQRLSGSVPKNQLISEHAYVTKKADEERQKRPNYRPILEYDGLLSHQSHNEDSRKMKTKEELLAEERDYKRRRMSYRGKKVKRSITEVMRDIIEEHMEEIKQAGGIGCLMKGSSDGVMFPSGSVSDQETAADVKLGNLGFDSSETREMQMGHYQRSLSSNDSFTRIENINLKDNHRREYSGRHESLYVQPRSIRKASERDREYRSRSPDNYRNHGHSHDRHRHQRDRDKKKVTEYKYDENRRSHESRSSSISDFTSDFSHRKNHEMPRSEGRHRDRMVGTHRSDNMTPSSFDDRYDPSESYGRFDGDVSSGSKYARTDKSYKSK
ncbi:hypothetical protein Sjap_009223 [Stephania japonica]|uniref:CHHC U11-48K-type domain-containing protein n=1 Tax=Stephania japonica TaxID=461633 RepID=A0AAP0JRJ8_9MAGN